MRRRSRRALVLGANGFLGWAACRQLVHGGWQVVGLDKNWDAHGPTEAVAPKDLEIHEASVLDRDALQTAMKDTDAVFCFQSFTVPATTPGYLQVELQTTLQAMENVLATMVEVNTERIVFPSSGGTIYGDTGRRAARESDALGPMSSYGAGKLLAEEMVLFYARVHGIKYTIMRISNAYGTGRIHRTSQGLIDVCLEKLLAEEPLVLWGNSEHVRDYIFLEDVMEAMGRVIELNQPASLVVNVGTGIPSTIDEVLSHIGRIVGVTIEPRYEPKLYGGLPYSVLDIGLLKSLTGWAPRYTLEEGIQEAWRVKRLTGAA